MQYTLQSIFTAKIITNRYLHQADLEPSLIKEIEECLESNCEGVIDGCHIPISVANSLHTGKNQRSEATMLKFANTLLIGMVLLTLMPMKSCSKGWGAIKTVENTYVKKVLWCEHRQKPGALISTLASSSTTAEQWSKTSSQRGCKCGTTCTSWQTLDNNLTVSSLTSLWHRIGKAPCGQLKAWDTEKSLPHTQWDGRLGGAKR